jgi:hypothetical protein
MNYPYSAGTICRHSDSIVAREIEGEMIIIPLTSGIGDLEDELYTLNETGKAIWDRLDGTRTIRQIAIELSAEFEGSAEQIEQDVIGLSAELLNRGILCTVSSPEG